MPRDPGPSTADRRSALRTHRGPAPPAAEPRARAGQDGRRGPQLAAERRRRPALPRPGRREIRRQRFEGVLCALLGLVTNNQEELPGEDGTGKEGSGESYSAGGDDYRGGVSPRRLLR